jgi:hypothetical protein
LVQNTEKIRQKIIDFWNTLYKKYEGMNAQELSKNDKELISDSIKLMGILEELDEESVTRIKFAIPYSQVNYNADYLIEYINELISDKDSAEKRSTVGQLMLDMMEYNVPTYPEDEIIKLVRYLYGIENEGVNELANKICNIYAKNNIMFLMDICKEYRDY